MKQFNLFLTGFLAVAALSANAQTNPTPHILSTGDYSFTGFLDAESTTYPPSMQGWRFGAEPVATTFGPATEDRALSPQSISSTSGGIRNEGLNGFSFLNSGTNNIGAVCIAINTVGLTQAYVAWTAQDIRDGATRENGVKLQYRLGSEGDFTDIENSAYLSNPTGLGTAQEFSLALPPAALDQAEVQLRWQYYLIAGSGSRDRIQIDEIVISQEENGGGGGNDDVAITFRVDMSQFTGTIHPAGMHLAGSFPNDQWTPSARQMTNDGDGIWSYTEMLPPGYALQYKFVRGPNWSDGDEIMTGLPCSAQGTSNRAIVIPDTNTELPAWCFAQCNECAANPNFVNITFQVDMSNVTINVGSGGTGISGTFNAFAFEQMTDQGNGVYAFTISLLEGSSVEYKFRNGSAEFENPPLPCGSGGFGNRVLIVPAEATTLPLVCYGSCDPCTTPGDFYPLTFVLDIAEIADPDPAGPHIAGIFNAFNPAPMSSLGGTLYSFTASVEEGSAVIWKYLNGPSFDNVETVPEECGSPDGFGGFNRSLVMPSQLTVTGPVCFGSCEVCASSPETYTLIFQIDAGFDITVDPAGLHIAGNFNDWNPVPMQNAGSGLYTFTAQVEGNGTEILWKYLNGPSWDGAETVPEDCGSPDGFGGFNRVFSMPSQTTILDVVCFSSCMECYINSTSSVNMASVNLLVFPNPTRGEVSFIAPVSGYSMLRIFDLSGKVIFSNGAMLSLGEVVRTTDIPRLPGVYLMELNTGEGIYRSRLVIH